jgi:hypothetical protein
MLQGSPETRLLNGHRVDLSQVLYADVGHSLGGKAARDRALKGEKEREAYQHTIQGNAESSNRGGWVGTFKEPENLVWVIRFGNFWVMDSLPRKGCQSYG